LSNNINKFIQFGILLLGLLTFPLWGFSQQEHPNRIVIVVTLWEIFPQKEIVQLPADNMPTVINVPATKVRTTIAKHTVKTKPIVSKNITATAKIEGKSTLTVKETPKQPMAKPIIPSSPTVTQQEKANTQTKPIENKSVSVRQNEPIEQKTISNKASKTPNVKSTEEQLRNDTSTTIKSKNDNKETAKFVQNTKTSSFSYIWIGILLVIAGVVLGLLFGKPAFLISFVGAVFIALGLLLRR